MPTGVTAADKSTVSAPQILLVPCADVIVIVAGLLTTVAVTLAFTLQLPKAAVAV